MNDAPRTITLALTGASGAQYGLRLLEQLLAADCRVWFLISKAAQMVVATETDAALPGRPAALAAAELIGASGRAVLDAYVIGFEIECRLGTIMNPRHYHERGWHCTSTIGTIGAAAAAAPRLGRSTGTSPHRAARCGAAAATRYCRPLHATHQQRTEGTSRRAHAPVTKCGATGVAALAATLRRRTDRMRAISSRSSHGFAR